MKFSIKDFSCKCDQILRKLRIWSHLLKKSLMENFIFLCSVPNNQRQNLKTNKNKSKSNKDKILLIQVTFKNEIYWLFKEKKTNVLDVVFA